MAYICYKNIPCSNCEHYRFDVDRMRYCCFARNDNVADKSKKKFMLLQVSSEKTRDKAWQSWETIKDNFDINDYCVVYETFVERGTSLDDLFDMFNFNHPSGYRGRSMSVSDLIYFPETGELYYVDVFGFVNLNKKRKLLKG